MANNNQDNLAVGCLVQWIGNQENSDDYGVVEDIDHRVVKVRWDAEGAPTQFTVQSTQLVRADLANSQVRRATSSVNAIANQLVPGTNPPMWRCSVIAPSGGFSTSVIPESDLRPVPITDPVERFQNAKIGSLKKYRLQEVTRWYLWQHMNNDLVSLGNVRVDIKPHQVGVVHKIISNYPHRFLLCDEVGLGKTIEAGMALKELRIRGGARRVLIIVPPNLARQWQFEMKTKFNETFAILNTDTVRYEESRGATGNPFARHDSVICSSSWVVNQEWARFCEEADWDIVIIDEAHHARRHEDGRTTRLYDLVHNLAMADAATRRSLLFLTATPMQLGTHELYALVELLDPVLFPSPEDFDNHRKLVPGLNRLVERLKNSDFSSSSSDFERIASKVAYWLGFGEETVRRRLAGNRDELDALANELSDRHLLTEVMVRNRKSVIGGFMPRVAARWEVELSQEERDALAALDLYIQHGFDLAKGSGGNAIGFVMVTFQKLMASSIAAIKSSLVTRRERIVRRAIAQLPERHLQEMADDDYDINDLIKDAGGYMSHAANMEVLLINHAIDALDQAKIDSKSATLLKQLEKLLNEDSDPKVLVFTQFRETQRHLADLLRANGWGVNLFHGQMTPEEKDRAVERFRGNAGPQILVSTEAGGEGRNFQFCHILVNYDLPWNPMKVEQRIGRVDRIGQEHTVNIFNLFAKNTIEERVLDVLENRINIFEETVGGLDPILGDTENDITKIMRLSADARKSEIEKLGSRLEIEVRQARQAAQLFGDFIMDTKSFGREIAERISGQPSPIDNDDVDVFMGQLLSDARTYIKRNGAEYQLVFNDYFVNEHKEFFAAGNKLSAVFRPDQGVDSQHTELMAFGNPIVDAIAANILDDRYEGRTGVRRILAGDDIAPTSGWLFTYMFTEPGVRQTEHIIPVFVSDDGQLNTQIGQRIVERACLFDPSEQEIDPLDIPDNLDAAKMIADEFVNRKHESLQYEATGRSMASVDQEIARLKKYFDYREQVATDKLQTNTDTLNRLSESLETAQQRQVLRIWEARVRESHDVLRAIPEERERRMQAIEKFRYPAVSYSLKSLGRIEVLEKMNA